MSIRVEFYGIPRHRAGVPFVELCEAQPRVSLAEVLRAVGDRFPALARDCLTVDRLRDEYAANLDGERFVRDPATPIPSGASLLIMSADAGG